MARPYRLLFYFMLLTLAARPALAGKWVDGPPVPQGGNEVVGAATDRYMVLYGGLPDRVNPAGWFEKFDPTTQRWTTLPTNPVPVHHAAATAIGHKIYIFGGFIGPPKGTRGIYWIPVNRSWVFDLETNRWTALAPMPTTRGAANAVAVGDKIYVIGGAAIPANFDRPGLTFDAAVQDLSVNEMYDTATNTWTAKSPMSVARNHATSAVVNGKIYVVGGRVGSVFSNGVSTNIISNEEYDPATDRWRSRKSMPTARSGISSAVIGGKMHVLGGEGWIGDFGGVFRTHETYDPEADSWTTDPPMPTPRHGFAVGAVGGKIYAVSGMNIAGGAGPPSPLKLMEIYEP